MLQRVNQILGRPIVQITYHVPDVVNAAERFARLFGWGPFHISKHIPLARCSYRGREGVLDCSAGYGQAGNMMVELVSQHSSQPSIYREMFKGHESGVHNVGIVSPDVRADLTRLRDEGHEVVFETETDLGARTIMVDMRRALGHMLQLQPVNPAIAHLRELVHQSSIDWDGALPARELEIIDRP